MNQSFRNIHLLVVRYRIRVHVVSRYKKKDFLPIMRLICRLGSLSWLTKLTAIGDQINKSSGKFHDKGIGFRKGKGEWILEPNT
jgi:hypothetical protein